jgi:hypothetical protein
VLTNHNDTVTNVLKIEGESVIITGSRDGAVKHISASNKVLARPRNPLVLNPFENPINDLN